ncbi:MAG: septum formation initiator family protein [Bacilli bacterium]|nr:septum formation initiator family protein [Bacilli bacterium]
MARNKQSKKKLKRRMMILGVSSLIIIVTVSFTIGKYWITIFEKYQEKKQLEKELVSLQEKEKELQLDAKKLQDSEYIARYAREKYLFSKEGEFIIKIPEDE